MNSSIEVLLASGSQISSLWPADPLPSVGVTGLGSSLEEHSARSLSSPWPNMFLRRKDRRERDAKSRMVELPVSW